MTQSGRLAVTGADLYFEIDGSGPAVVLVHGFSLDTRMWDPQVPALCDIATVVRFDIRGFGRSSLPAPGVPYSQSGDLLAVLDHLEIRNAVLVGLSMGGLVVLHAALVAPDRVRALVLLDSLLDGVAWDEATEEAFSAAARSARADGVEAAKGLWLAHPFFAPARRDAGLEATLRSLVDPWTGFHWTHDDPREPLSPSPNAGLEHITAPTTVIVGELDSPCFHTMARTLAERIRGARLIEIPDAGHMVNLEVPDRVNQVLREVIGAPG